MTHAAADTAAARACVESARATAGPDALARFAAMDAAADLAEMRAAVAAWGAAASVADDLSNDDLAADDDGPGSGLILTVGISSLNTGHRGQSKAGRPSRDWTSEVREVERIPAPGVAWSSPTEWCTRTQRQRVYSCPTCPASTGTFVQCVPCRMLDCHTCRAAVRVSRGNALYKRFGGLGSFHGWEFTFPAKWRMGLGPRAVAALRGRLHDVLVRWYGSEWEGARFGFLVFVHPCGTDKLDNGDKTDGLTWRPHFHVIVPTVGLRAGQLFEAPAALEPWQLASMRAEWGAVLDELADAWGVPHEPSNVHFEYDRDAAAKVHRLQYCARSFPRWSATGTGYTSTLSTYRAFGLCSPRSRVAGADEWRARMRATVPAVDIACPCCKASALAYVRSEHAPHGYLPWPSLDVLCMLARSERGPPEAPCEH